MKKAFIFIALILVFIAIPSIKHLTAQNSKEVTVQKVVLQSIKSSILVSGHLTHEEKAVLSSEVIGKVKSILVKEGESVTKGQIVSRIDDEESLAEVKRNTASVRVQEIEIERQKLRVQRLSEHWKRNRQLFELKQIQQDSFEAVTLDLNLAKTDLESAKESLLQVKAQLDQSMNRLEKTRIYSPINGVVTSVDIKPGETAIPSAMNIPGSTILTIDNPLSVYAQVNVDEADVANIEVGNEAEVIFIAYPNKPVKGIVESISNSAKIVEGRQGRSFSIKIRITVGTDIKLLSGMSCRAEIFTRTLGNVLAVPIKSIVMEENKANGGYNHYVFVNRNNTANKIIVKVGIADDEYQEIIQGLKAGDEIISGPDQVLQHLRQDDSIKIDKI